MKAEKKFDRMPFAVSRPGDSPEMILAIRALEVANVEIRRPENNPYQLKASPTVSFYPSKGTIYVNRRAKLTPYRRPTLTPLFVSAGGYPGSP